ncbi:hypothetical_protein [Candidozyma auris]|uniref:hypothetical_protein n=1 Tax=Candidozyma auris TaxID=498019 RepID=UPI000D2D5E3A|nr:hypothetical_protein [[Candida] auris]QEO20574.1 hypothetical_protein [[Candida] auris]GBL49454.1 hypothetical protein CAJCM15448_17280 [[Candida] auris]
MKSSALVAMAASVGLVSAACDFIEGNYYCSKTNKVAFQNVGFSSSYQDVTSMDENSGKCTQETHHFSGNLAPLNEELSFHFRGPLKLKQFGVYYPKGGNSKRDAEADEDCSTTKHVHHKHVKRATAFVTQTVFVDQYGNTVTSTATPSTAAGESYEITQTNTASVSSDGGAPSGSSNGAVDASSSSASSGSQSTSNAQTGDWVRSSYYKPGTAENCTFLNHHGGSGSGVWSSALGNSLSYANSDNSGGASSPQILSDVTIESNTEFVIMSGLKCGDDSENGDCGFYRKGIPAYHGFSGDTKLFVFEFLMPSDGSKGFNADMPAIWALNAKIPRTLQYGEATCSCWKSGCGELDLFEILHSGSDKLIAHLHSGQGSNGSGYGGGGSQDYFERPTENSIKAAVIMTGKEIVIKIVDDDFDSVLTADTVDGWLDASGTVAKIAN